MKEGVVDEHIPAVPVGGPAPAAPTPAAPAAKIETEIYTGIPPQTHFDPWVKKGWVNSPVRWSPYVCRIVIRHVPDIRVCRSEEHTSELQSLRHLVCRLLLEKKYTT